MKLVIFVFSVAAFGAGVKLTWADTVNPLGTQYNAYRIAGTCAAPVFTAADKINAAPIDPKEYTDANRPPGTYCYAVTAVSATSLESAKSVPFAVVVPLPTSVAPTGLTAIIVP